MTPSTLRKPLFALGLIAASLSWSCEVYDAPPDVRLVPHPEGSYSVGEALLLNFTETIDPDTLSVKIWPATRGTRRIPLSEVEPVTSVCNFKASPCGEVELAVEADGRRAGVLLNGEIARPGVPMILEVTEGLADEFGNKTGVSRYFSFQLQPPESENTEPVEFDSGVFILGGTVTKPVPAVLTLVTNIHVRSDGRMALAGARGVVLNDEPRTTRDPQHIEVDHDETGWTLYAQGHVTIQEDGSRQLRTESFQVTLPVVGLEIRMSNVRIVGPIVKDENGNDKLDGTLTWETLVLVSSNGRETTYDGDSASLIGEYIPQELIPVGHPEVCGNVCGGVTGLCNPPEDFPVEGFCDPEEEPAEEE